MPFINIKTNLEVDSAVEEEIKKALGKAIEIIPGKSESWLMVNFEDNCHLYFKGDKTLPNLFVELKIYGTASGTTLEKFTAEATKIFNMNLGVSPDHMYFKYELVDNWGWNGSNF